MLNVQYVVDLILAIGKLDNVLIYTITRLAPSRITQ